MDVRKTKPVVMFCSDTNADPTSRRVDLSQCNKCTIVIGVEKDNVAATQFELEQADAATGGTSKALTVTVPVYSNLNAGIAATAASEELTRRTNDVDYALDAESDARSQLVVFEVDPATLDINNGFRWLQVGTSTGNADNHATVIAILELRESE